MSLRVFRRTTIHTSIISLFYNTLRWHKRKAIKNRGKVSSSYFCKCVRWNVTSPPPEMSVDPQQPRDKSGLSRQTRPTRHRTGDAVRLSINRRHLPAINALYRTVAMGTVVHGPGSRQGNSSSPRLLLTHFRSSMLRYCWCENSHVLDRYVDGER